MGNIHRRRSIAATSWPHCIASWICSIGRSLSTITSRYATHSPLISAQFIISLLYGGHSINPFISNLFFLQVRIPGDKHEILINPLGMVYREMTASSFVKISLDGRILDAGSTPLGSSLFLNYLFGISLSTNKIHRNQSGWLHSAHCCS